MTIHDHQYAVYQIHGWNTGYNYSRWLCKKGKNVQEHRLAGVSDQSIREQGKQSILNETRSRKYLDDGE